jgi:hypothetical protein
MPEDDELLAPPPPACTWQFKNHLSCNNTDIQSKDLKGKGVKLPANTTDEAGIAACTAACGKVPECAAWVFVSTRAVHAGDTPRCALKGALRACPIPHMGTTTGVLAGKPQNCTAPAPSPPPPPPPGPPPPLPAGWVAGHINGGPLALRETQDALDVRILVDGSVIESFWDGGRARTASRAYPPAVAKEQLGLAVSATSGGGGDAVKGITVDVEVFEMGNAWLEPIE